MEKTNFEYNGFMYPAVTVEIPENIKEIGGETLTVAGEELGYIISSAFECEPDEYRKNLQVIDEQIACFVPEEILDGSEEAIVEYLIKTFYTA